MPDMKDVDATPIDVVDLNKRRSPFRRFGILGSILIILFIAWVAWSWGFCRFYVGPGKMAIITAKSGSALPPGQILAKPGQKGVLEEPLG